MDLLITCKSGFEKILSNELALYKFKTTKRGNGWIRGEITVDKTGRPEFLNRACFAATTFKEPVEIHASSVNALIDELIKIFLARIGDNRVTEPWPLIFSSSDDGQLSRRVNTVEKGWIKKLSKNMSRVAKLATPGLACQQKFAPGFFVHFTDFDHALVSFQGHHAGQQRMRMDDAAPSRSFLKIEEAYHIFGEEPQKGEIVVDLGAAPGGWSYSALKRKAYVTAIDNADIKEPAKSDRRITHLTTDALQFSPYPDIPVDWLFCDIIEDPDVILSLIQEWLTKNWCRNFIVNLKMGRRDPILLLKKIDDPIEGISSLCRRMTVRHLYHNREEITMMGERL